MTLMDCSRWTADLDEVLDTLPELRELEGKTVLITGAGGLICSAAAELLLRYNDRAESRGKDAVQAGGPAPGPITVLAAGRSRERMAARFGARLDGEKGDLRFLHYDAAAADDHPEAALPGGCDYIIHGASNAYPSKIVKEPVETMLSNLTGLAALLELARRKKSRRLLFVSSSEVYGRKEGMEPSREDEYGYIDLLNPRSSYSVGKRAAETLCASYSAEYGVETVIVRPGHIYGPTASEADNRVSSVWAYAAARGEDLVMKSDGAQLRSYCHCLDCASAMLKILLRGESAHAYNVSNRGSVITIREMAEILARQAGVRLIREEASAEEKKGFNPMSNSSLNAESLEALGWKGCFDAERGFGHTVEILRETGQGQRN